MLWVMLILYILGILVGGYYLMGRLSSYLRRNNNRDPGPPRKQNEKKKKSDSHSDHPWYNTNDNP